jgi:hypothetical protein
MKIDFTKNLGLKALALLLAIFIYYAFKSNSPTDKHDDRTFFRFFKY